MSGQPSKNWISRESGSCSKTTTPSIQVVLQKEWLKKNKVNVLEWSSQSPDLNPIEMFWKDLKQAIHRRKATNIPELKWFCTEEWAKYPTSHCSGLISTYKKRLPAVIAEKESHTRYWKQRFTYFCNAQLCKKIWGCFGSCFCRNMTQNIIRFYCVLWNAASNLCQYLMCWCVL